MPVYLAVRGKVFDVTSGKNFYGPGGPYENFAGRDASRGLACGSFDEDMLTKDLYGPLDDLSGLGQDEMQAMQDWEDRFTGTISAPSQAKGPSSRPKVESQQTSHNLGVSSLRHIQRAGPVSHRLC